MISNEEMYEFASQIAGITDEDLKQYKCGGRMKKDDGGVLSKAQKLFSQKMNEAKTLYSKLDSDIKVAEAKKKLEEERKKHPEYFDNNGNIKYTKETAKKYDRPTNEDQRPDQNVRKLKKK